MKKSQTVKAKLILYNDDINTFDFVITSLIDLLEFESAQAEQLTLLAHFKGKTTLKTGDRLILDSISEQFKDIGLKVEVEEN
jgi:ATP-dependent Clp protease adaptor protein ClpS